MTTQRQVQFGLPMVRQLIEIDDARRKRKEPSIGSEVQALITRLTSGGVSPGAIQPGGKRRKSRVKLPDRDPRILQQAKVLWDKGWGDVKWWKDFRGDTRGAKDFAEYLATIPDISQFPTAWDARFPHLVLVDQRIQIVEACRFLNVNFSGTNDTFVPHDSAKSITDPVYWMRCQDGKAYRNRKSDDCRTEFASRGDEIGAEVHEGLALYAQFPDLLEVNTAWDLPSSVRSDDRGFCACLGRWADDDVKLYWLWDAYAHPIYGSVSRGSGTLNP